jgi:hypothetical protein
MKRLRLWQVLVGLIALALLFVISILLQRSPPADETRSLPDPNGYDDLLKAAAEAMPIEVPGRSIDDLTTEELRAATENNREALRLARAAFGKQCRVPAEFSQTYLARHMAEMGSLKGLAQAFLGEGRLAEKENRYGDAARSYLDAVRLGQSISQGGFVIDRLVGIAIERIGMIPLARVAHQLNAKDCRELMVALEKIESAREPWQTVARRERTLARQALGWKYFLAYPVFNRMQRQGEERASRKALLCETQLRLLMLNLALRIRQLDEGTLPQNLAELVPSHLEAVTLDPFSNRPFIYQIERTGFKLYSVGPDGKDNGGVSIGRSSADVPSGDVLLDSPY